MILIMHEMHWMSTMMVCVQCEIRLQTLCMIVIHISGHGSVNDHED
jgi:fatty acid desaturase